ESRKRERERAHRDKARIPQLRAARYGKHRSFIYQPRGAQVTAQLLVERLLDTQVAAERRSIDHLAPRQDAAAIAQQADRESHARTVWIYGTLSPHGPTRRPPTLHSDCGRSFATPHAGTLTLTVAL